MPSHILLPVVSCTFPADTTPERCVRLSLDSVRPVRSLSFLPSISPNIPPPSPPVPTTIAPTQQLATLPPRLPSPSALKVLSPAAYLATPTNFGQMPLRVEPGAHVNAVNEVYDECV